jgi:hypothetical protein
MVRSHVGGLYSETALFAGVTSRLIAERFSVRKAQVSIKSGTSGRMKLVQIADA